MIIRTILAALLLGGGAATASLFGQQTCNGLFAFQQGAVLEYAHLDSKGKLLNKSQHEVKSLSATPDGGVAAEVRQVLSNEKGKTISDNVYHVKCLNNTLTMDLSDLVPPQSKEAFANMEVSITGDELSLPDNLKEGQSLPDASTEIKGGTGGVTLFTLSMAITDRKVGKQEKIKTPAGEFDCIKLTYSMQLKMMVAKSFSVTEWRAPGIGVVRQENYDKKGNLDSVMELAALKK